MTLDDMDIRRKRLIYRSWHRGTREMDLILGRFADRHIGGFSPAELDQYEQLLTCSDPDLYNWISRREPVPADIDMPVLARLMAEQDYC